VLILQLPAHPIPSLHQFSHKTSSTATRKQSCAKNVRTWKWYSRSVMLYKIRDIYEDDFYLCSSKLWQNNSLPSSFKCKAKQKKKPSNCWNYFLHIHHSLPLWFLEVEGKKYARGEVQNTFRSRWWPACRRSKVPPRTTAENRLCCCVVVVAAASSSMDADKIPSAIPTQYEFLLHCVWATNNPLAERRSRVSTQTVCSCCLLWEEDSRRCTQTVCSCCLLWVEDSRRSTQTVWCLLRQRNKTAS